MDWQKTIEKHGQIVWGIAWKMLGNESDASDCFQEVFLKAVQYSRKEKIRDIGAFLSRLTYQKAIDQLRKRKTLFNKFVSQPDCEHEAQNTPDPSGHMQSEQLAQRLSEALASIPAQEAEVFCLKVLQEFSYRQIAQQLGIKENYVGVLLNRAKLSLRSELKNNAAVINESEVTPWLNKKTY